MIADCKPNVFTYAFVYKIQLLIITVIISRCNCRKEGEAAVKIAKRNIEKHYISVGMLEKRRESLVVLEYLLPQYFANATKLYDSKGEYHVHILFIILFFW